MLYSECKSLFINYVGSYAAAPTMEYYKINLAFFDEYITALKVEDFDILDLTKNDFVSYIAHLRTKKIKNTSVQTYARAIKAFLRWCFNEGYMLENITLNVKFPKSDKNLIVPLSSAAVSRLESAMGKSYLKYRNWLMLHLMLDCGLRRSEVINLNYQDLYLEDNYMRIIDSKNNKSRIVPLSGKVVLLLQRYDRECAIHSKLERKPLLLDGHYKNRITEDAIEQLFQKLKKVQIDIHPHLLRHTFATSFILGGGSLEVLRILMGHSSYAVTMQYLHIAMEMNFMKTDIYKLDDVFFQVYNYRR